MYYTQQRVVDSETCLLMQRDDFKRKNDTKVSEHESHPLLTSCKRQKPRKYQTQVVATVVVRRVSLRLRGVLFVLRNVGGREREGPLRHSLKN